MPEVQELDLDNLEPISIPVKWQGKKYTLREATCAAAIAYRNQRQSCYIYDKEGFLTSIRNVASLESFLISLTLFDEKGEPVPESTISAWPSRVTRQLFDRVFTISELAEGGTAKEDQAEVVEDPAKNEQSGSTSSSS